MWLLLLLWIIRMCCWSSFSSGELSWKNSWASGSNSASSIKSIYHFQEVIQGKFADADGLRFKQSSWAHPFFCEQISSIHMKTDQILSTLAMKKDVDKQFLMTNGVYQLPEFHSFLQLQPTGCYPNIYHRPNGIDAILKSEYISPSTVLRSSKEVHNSWSNLR
jgi:hypothetical protein